MIVYGGGLVFRVVVSEGLFTVECANYLLLDLFRVFDFFRTMNWRLWTVVFVFIDSFSNFGSTDIYKYVGERFF